MTKQSMPTKSDVKRNSRRDLIVIGGSAGALDALRRLVSMLPKDLLAAIVVVVHIPNEFPSYLAGILERSGALPTKEVKSEEKLRQGTVYVAGPDRHLLVEDGSVIATRGPRENRHRPAIDPLFRSAARAHGRRVIGVILSGTLDDGSSGLMAVKMAGGLTVVQDAREAEYPEMPQRAKRYAGADHELPIAEIAKLLMEATSRSGPKGGEVAMSEEIGKEAEKANLESNANKEKQGEPSRYACPDCHGVLWEIKEGELLRFRCRVGHAYTADALNGAMSEMVEQALWASMRAMEEKASLLRRIGERSGLKLATEYKDEARGYDKHVETIREVLVTNQKLQDKEEAAD